MRSTARRIALVAASIMLTAAFGMMASATVRAQDRLLGMVEPVKAKKPYRIALSSADMNSDFFLALAYGVVDEAQQAGVQVVRILSAGGYGKVAEQVAQLEELNALKPDAVILVAAAFDGFDKVVDRLVENGIKVVAVGTPISSKKVSLVAMQNEGGIGGMEADYICKQKPGAKVVTLPGPAGSEWNKLRFEGFKAAAAKCKLNLVGTPMPATSLLTKGSARPVTASQKSRRRLRLCGSRHFCRWRCAAGETHARPCKGGERNHDAAYRRSDQRWLDGHGRQ